MTTAEEALAMAARLQAMAGPVKPNVLDQAADLLERIARELADCKAPQEAA